jgi:hypothetical protein
MVYRHGLALVPQYLHNRNMNNQKWKALVLGGLCTLPLSVYAQNAALVAGLNDVAGDATDTIEALIPVVLIVMGLIFIITVGMKFFSRLGKRG